MKFNIKPILKEYKSRRFVWLHLKLKVTFIRFSIRLVFVLCACLLFSHAGIAQDWESNKQNLIKNLSDYRANLLLRDTATTYDLRALMVKWNDSDVNASEEDLFQFSLDVVYFKWYYKADFKRFVKYQLKKNPVSRLINGFTPRDYHTVGNNFDLIDLINLEVLIGKYPYKINGYSGVFKELEFYQIRSNDKIAEIGSGNGSFSLVLALMRDDIFIYINEIRKFYVDYIESKIENNRRWLNEQQLVPVHGRKSKTNLASGEFDKVIIRNSFHHFSKKKQMLASVKSALKADGQLFIMEYPTELDDDGDYCSLALSTHHIKQIMVENDFVLVDQQQFEETILLRYVVAY